MSDDELTSVSATALMALTVIRARMDILFNSGFKAPHLQYGDVLDIRNEHSLTRVRAPSGLLRKL